MTGGQEDKDVLHTSPVMVLTGLGETKTIVKTADLYRAGTHLSYGHPWASRQLP